MREPLDIRRFGASESATPSVNATAIQAALDEAAEAGGGCVTIPAGTFVSGTLWLRPNIELHLADGAVLMASPDLADYNAPDAYPENYGCPGEYWNACHFIIAHHADGASITGPGVIHGNGDVFYDEEPSAYLPWMNQDAHAWWNGIRWAKDKERLRPGQLVVFVKCRDISVRNLTIRNSPCWSLFFWGCERVRVSDYTVRNGENDGNSDGIDFDCSRDIVLERADINTGDDAIAIRASAREFAPEGRGRLGIPAITEDVRIQDCILHSSSSAIRIGVGEGVIRNVAFESVTCDRCGTAVSISTRYGDAKNSGTDIEDIFFKNCRFTGCRTGPNVTCNGGDRLEFGIRNVQFDNCNFTLSPQPPTGRKNK